MHVLPTLLVLTLPAQNVYQFVNPNYSAKNIQQETA